MAKTKNISLRLDEDDLKLASEATGISKPQKLIDFLLSEYVRPLKKKAPYFISSTKVDVYGTPTSPFYPLEEKISNRLKTLKEYPYPNIPPKDNDDIQILINTIRNEKIPPERNTPLGKKIWIADQEKRISELQKQLK